MSINEHLTKTIHGFYSLSSKATQKRSRRFCEKGDKSAGKLICTDEVRRQARYRDVLSENEV